jgi:hypothetical protein
MSSYPTEAWQESGNTFCKDNPFPPRANGGGFFQPELGYVNNGNMQNGGGGPFVPNRLGGVLC